MLISRWDFPQTADDPEIGVLAKELSVPHAAGRILWRRGYRDAARAKHFLNPRLEDLHDPFLLRDMGCAVERIRTATGERELIEIHGDYDVDGITSTVLLKKALELAGGQA